MSAGMVSGHRSRVADVSSSSFPSLPAWSGFLTDEDAGHPTSLFSKPCPTASRVSSIFTGSGQESTCCSHCGRKVEILAGKSLLEVAAFMKANPGACIVIDGRLGLQGGGPADAGLTGLGGGITWETCLGGFRPAARRPGSEPTSSRACVPNWGCSWFFWCCCTPGN